MKKKRLQLFVSSLAFILALNVPVAYFNTVHAAPSEQQQEDNEEAEIDETVVPQEVITIKETSDIDEPKTQEKQEKQEKQSSVETPEKTETTEEETIVESPEAIYTYVTVNAGSLLFEPNKTTKALLQLTDASTIYHVNRADNDNWYELSIGQSTYWVARENLSEANIEIVVPEVKKTVSITTKNSFKIYNKPSTTSTVLAKGSQATKLKTINIVDNYFVVNVGNQIGYISFKDVELSFKSSDKVEIANKSVTLYTVVNSKFKKIGTLTKGAIFKPTKTTSKYHYIKKSGKQYAVPIAGTMPTKKANSLATLKSATYPITLYAEKASAVYDQNGIKIGSLNKGQTVHLKGISKGHGIIEYLGQSGYVDLANYYHKNIVNPTKNVTYKAYSYYVKVFAKLYPEFTSLEKIGESVEGRAIYALRVGNGKKEILVDAAIHAREHMTTNVVMEMIDNYSYSYNKKTSFAGYNVRQTLDTTSIWFVPMINPDGVTLVQNGINSMANKNLIKQINKSSNYKRWKANARGVDLNRNFDGEWKYVPFTSKTYKGYKGPRVFSEPESQALKAFVERHKFKSDISYHSSGQILYWFNFQNSANYKRDLALTRQISRVTGYSIIPPLYVRGSGSSADWFIMSQKKPGITVEIAPYAGEGPVSHKHWNNVWNKNKSIGLLASKEASKR
ncbi:M14 family zinc carboxypeptidase [Viridibacillus sp. FSL E2-0187]|uniref:M14 family zinc carboxypeptidase n=1 Tax=Viridibacillus sp. FSL E2-0187 TaxID=2921362 RepID=UPI0030F5B538